MRTPVDESVCIAGQQRVLRRSGHASGATVVLVHPLGLDRRAFDALRGALEPSWHVLSYDQRGHGTRATEHDFELADLVEDAAAVCENVGGPVHLVGHAMGGVVAALAAARLRNALSLAVMAVPLRSQPAFAQRAQALDAGSRGAVFDDSLARWFKGLETELGYAPALAYGRSCLEAASVAGYANGWRALAAFGDLTLGEPGLPTLCIAAADDASVPLAAFDTLRESPACAAGTVRVEVTPRGGHMFPLMAPEATATLLQRFWKAER